MVADNSESLKRVRVKIASPSSKEHPRIERRESSASAASTSSRESVARLERRLSSDAFSPKTMPKMERRLSSDSPAPAYSFDPEQAKANMLSNIMEQLEVTFVTAC